MSYLRYNHVHERERDLHDDPFYSRPLVRVNSKRQRADIYDDDEYDDYPTANRPSTSLVRRAPTQIEKYNIWQPSTPSRNDRRYDSDEEDRRERTTRYKVTHKHYSPARDESDDEDEREREREFRLKVKATFGIGRPKSSQSSSSKMMYWPGEMFRSKERWTGEDWERRERVRVSDDFWTDEPRYEERTERFRRFKRSKTNEWKPLSNLRRF